MKNTLLDQIKWFSIVAIAEDYGYPCDTPDDFKVLAEIVYEDLKKYEKETCESKQI